MSADIRTPSTAADPLFDLTRPELLVLWDRLQRLQVDIVFLQELAAYYTSPGWHASRRVLDMGSGNGHYLQRLASRFPGKAYLGVDLAPQLVDIARREAAGPGCRFECIDMSDVGDTHDFVILRLLLQHLPDIDGALDKLARITRPGATALVIDSNDAVRFFHPPLPEVMQLFSHYTTQQAGEGRDRRAAQLVIDKLVAHPEWRLGATWQITAPSTLPGNLDTFRQIYTDIIELLGLVGQLPCDFAALRQAWAAWCADAAAYTQVGVSIVRLERV